MARYPIDVFQVANPIYAGAVVTFFTVSGGVKTATKATVYAGETGTTELSNPVTLDGQGRFKTIPWAEVSVIAAITGLSVPDHDTAVLADAQTHATDAAASAAAAAASAAAAGSFDMPFHAGYTATFGALDLTVQTYGSFIVSRPGSFTGEVAKAGVAPTGAAAIFDITKNGVSIYSTKPQFEIAATTITAGVLKVDGTEDFVSGDIIKFLCTQIGSTVAGAQVDFTAKAQVT